MIDELKEKPETIELAYEIGYASGLKAKAEEMSKSVEKLFPATILDKKVEQVKR
jgi:hypothetical protein